MTAIVVMVLFPFWGDTIQHRHVSLRIALLLALCACHGQRPGQAWASTDRSTYIYEQGDRLVSARGRDRHVFARGTGCFTSDPERVFVAEDGRRALLLGWHATGGSWFDHVETELDLACMLDISTGGTAPLVVALPGTNLDDSPVDTTHLVIGAFSGWVYHHGLASDSFVIGDGKGHETTLPFPGRDGGGSECALVERADATVIACERFLETSRPSSGPSTYRFWLDTAVLDRSAFPPTITSRRQIDVVRAESVRISRDGRLVAWWYGGHGGIAELSTGRALGDVDGGQLWDVDFNAGDTEAVVLEETADNHYVVRRLALAGMSEREQITLGFEAHRVYWLADGRILVSSFSDSQLITPRR